MDDREAIAALVSDLYWQIDQMKPRGIRDKAGNPYNPSYYKRGLKTAVSGGGLSVAEFVKHHLTKAPSASYKKLEESDSLDLACEALVIDESKPYAFLFNEADRAAAKSRLAPYVKAIEARKAAQRARIDDRHTALPADLDQLRELATTTTDAEHAIAINAAIVKQAPEDIVALNRLGRAYDTIGAAEQAEEAFRQVIAVDPNNAIAARRLRDLLRRQ